MREKTVITYLQEEGFRQQMHRQAEPYLRRCCRSGRFTSFDGTWIFYCAYVPQHPKASIVISHGFTEFAEKYNEMVFYFLQAGYAVFLPEHRGHGRSQRVLRNMDKVYVKSFAHYVRDLHIFVHKIVKPYQNEIMLFAHSMGGAIGALYLQRYPDDFKKAVLSSPMIQMNVKGMPYDAAMLTAYICRALGFGRAYAAGQHGFRAKPRFERSSCLSLERYLYAHEKRLKNWRCQTSGASYGWVCAAREASRYVQDNGNIARIHIPVLVFAAGREHMVNTDEICRFAGKLKNARLVWMLDARHEIFNGKEQMRMQFYQELFAFLQQ